MSTSAAGGVDDPETAVCAVEGQGMEHSAVIPTGENLPTTAKEVAEHVLRWAKDHRLFARQPMEEAAEVLDVESDTDLQGPQMFSAPQVEAVMRKRAINLITFDENSKKVVIFTKSRVTISDNKILPFASQGISIEYMVGGMPQVRGEIPPTHEPKPFHVHGGRYCCGSSIFPANCIGAGTLGLLARDAGGRLFGVTNNHVTGACNHARPGLPILAPGPLDVSDDGINPFCIGRHERLIPINDGIPENMDISGNIDASCFLISEGEAVCSMQGDICDTPSIVAAPEPGQIVEKVGRTTGHTRGRIVGQSASPVPVFYKLQEYGIQKSVFFDNVFIVEGLQGEFSKRGDSGSLVMSVASDGSRKSVGLVFAGDEQRGLSFLLPLRLILDRLNLTLCSALNL